MNLFADDPIALFGEWLNDAKACKTLAEPTAMALATAANNIPSVRIVLLKHFDARGFVFYTNLASRKSVEIKANTQVALCFNWIAIGRQVRVEGVAEPASEAEADTYFNSRYMVSRLGAIASEQSRPLESRETLERKVKMLQAQYAENDSPPRPKHWGGWRVVPSAIEFWSEGEFRLHDRIVYQREGDSWRTQRLYP